MIMICYRRNLRVRRRLEPNHKYLRGTDCPRRTASESHKYSRRMVLLVSGHANAALADRRLVRAEHIAARVLCNFCKNLSHRESA